MSEYHPTRRGLLQAALGTTAAMSAAEALSAQENASARRNPLKITGVKTYYFTHQLPRPVGPSVAYISQRTALLVKITTDAGLVGWGETASLTGVRATIEELGQRLIGRNPLEHRKLWRLLWGPNFGDGLAVGALDIALEDLRGKVLGLSITDLYGGRVRDRVPAYASAMNYTRGVAPEDQYPGEAASLVKRGFRALKMRLGGLPISRDSAVAAAVREAVGPDILLMADGNGAYTLHAAIRMGRELEKLDYFFFEEPLPQAHAKYPGYEALTNQLDIPIAAGEALGSRATARELIVRGAMRIIQPDATLCGGIGECLFVADMARLWSVPCIPHCWGGALAVAAAIQVVALLPDTSWGRTTETPLLELDVYENPFRDKLAGQPFALRDGMVDVPTRPGLGIEVDEDFIRKYET